MTIPTVGPGSIRIEQDGPDRFLLLHGLRVAKRGRVRRTKKWIPIVPWVASVIEDTHNSVIIRYARDKVGTA